jgi:hypothetical protein
MTVPQGVARGDDEHESLILQRQPPVITLGLHRRDRELDHSVVEVTLDVVGWLLGQHHQDSGGLPVEVTQDPRHQ